MKSVVIVQAYVPAYRRPFFERVVSEFEAADIRCRVLLTGETEGAQAARQDHADGAQWSKNAQGRSLEIGGRLLRLSSQRRYWSRADAVVFPLAGSWLDVYRALLTRHRPKVGLWGHVAPYTQAGVGLDLRLERWQMRHADHVFAYTQVGRRFAIDAGIDASRVTALDNTFDVVALQSADAQVTDRDVGGFRAQHALDGHRVFAVLGALDRPKRVDFLRRALDELWRRDPEARVLVAGEGRDGTLLDIAERRGQLIRLGRADDTTKALIGRTATLLLNPGRIGLTAVDALALRLPVVTTSTALHGPEAEYLEQGESLFATPDDPRAFIDAALALGTAPLAEASRLPTLDHMVCRFVAGTREMLG